MITEKTQFSSFPPFIGLFVPRVCNYYPALTRSYSLSAPKKMLLAIRSGSPTFRLQSVCLLYARDESRENGNYLPFRWGLKRPRGVCFEVCGMVKTVVIVRT